MGIWLLKKSIMMQEYSNRLHSQLYEVNCKKLIVRSLYFYNSPVGVL